VATTGRHVWENGWYVGCMTVWFTASLIGALVIRDHFDWIQLALSAFCFFTTFFQRRRHLGHF
jgi:hypothetical protein